MRMAGDCRLGAIMIMNKITIKVKMMEGEWRLFWGGMHDEPIS